ncbi:MAG: helix-turn-helix transcriptional regulator [Bdellovibrionaceae bacterium]|nr:helix-turn-helix transcriptional regulator [Pseudobdellovibrionaceae bacterium]
MAPARKIAQFGKNICQIRMRRELTQEELAERSELSRGFLQDIEAGRKLPTLRTILALRKALDVEWVDLFKGL